MLFKITSLFYAYPRAPFSASFYALESLDVQLYFLSLQYFPVYVAVINKFDLIWFDSFIQLFTMYRGIKSLQLSSITSLSDEQNCLIGWVEWQSAWPDDPAVTQWRQGQRTCVNTSVNYLTDQQNVTLA